MAGRVELVPGSQLGRYELLTPIAQGGMAAVWAARQSGSHGFQKTVALKTMLPALSDSAQFEQMFLAESRNAMRVHHPNVVEILDLGEEDGLVYLVMEWVDGESLSTLIKASEKRGAALPLRLGIHVCLRACLGLHAAHEVTDEDDRPLGLVHRDVSPQNIMVTYDGHVKVVDFGVAKSHVEASATLTGQFKGKVPYMSPEQATADRVDRRSDVFSMGILLYRITTGVHPFGGTNQLSTLHNILHTSPKPPRELDPSYPEDL
jgi:eukaryotic-like serine/threonine-protein kinase